MNTWTKVIAGVVVGVAGTIYATNEEARKNLPKNARDFPNAIRRRYEDARTAAREASSLRRQEILDALERHDKAHAGRVPAPAAAVPEAESRPEPAPDTPAAPVERPAERPAGRDA